MFVGVTVYLIALQFFLYLYSCLATKMVVGEGSKERVSMMQRMASGEARRKETPL
jgi:hypothetical protein